MPVDTSTPPTDTNGLSTSPCKPLNEPSEKFELILHLDQHRIIHFRLSQKNLSIAKYPLETKPSDLKTSELLVSVTVSGLIRFLPTVSL